MMPLPPTVDLVRELRARGHRITPARRAVWDVLSAADEHLTAEAVAQASASEGRPVERASVYRTLDLLEQHLAHDYAFEVQWVELHVIGTCAGCSGRAAPACSSARAVPGIVARPARQLPP